MMGKQAIFINQDLQVNILIAIQVSSKRDWTEVCPIEMNQGYYDKIRHLWLSNLVLSKCNCEFALKE